MICLLEQVTIDDMDDLLRVFKTYVLTSDDRGRREFRISARSEGLCAALLWRELQIRKVSMTMLEFSKRIKLDRMTISCILRDWMIIRIFRLASVEDLLGAKRKFN